MQRNLQLVLFFIFGDDTGIYLFIYLFIDLLFIYLFIFGKLLSLFHDPWCSRMFRVPGFLDGPNSLASPSSVGVHRLQAHL